MTFDLLDQPWIPVMGMDGRIHRVGIHDVLHHAEKYRALALSPLEDVVLTRLLVAFAHRALGNPDTDRWCDIWESGQFPAQDITDYADTWRSRFDLFGTVAPFMQSPTTMDAEPSGTDVLVPESSSISRPLFAGFDTNTMSGAQGAIALLVCHAYDTAGLKTGAPSGRSFGNSRGLCGNGQIVMAQGRTLFHTLMLNMIASDSIWSRSGPGDLPAWERPVLAVTDQRNTPDGPIDAMTWQSRRIQLVHDGYLVTGAYRVGPGKESTVDSSVGHRYEHMMMWRTLKAQKDGLPQFIGDSYAPMGWRGFSGAYVGGKTSTTPATPVVEWVCELQVDHGIFDVASTLSWSRTGAMYGNKCAVIDDVHHERVTAPAADFRADGASCEALTTLVDRIVDTIDDAGRFAYRAAITTDGANPDRAASMSDGARSAAWSTVTPVLTRWAMDTSESDPATVLEATARSCQRACDTVLDSLGTRAYRFPEIITARAKVGASIHRRTH